MLVPATPGGPSSVEGAGEPLLFDEAGAPGLLALKNILKVQTKRARNMN